MTPSTCIGCGARDLRRECTGDCADRKLELVAAAEHEQLLSDLAAARDAVFELEAVALRLAGGEPAPESLEETYRELQGLARAALRRERVGSAHLDDAQTTRIVTWWCASCGRIEAPQACIGVCVRQPETLVSASIHDPVAADAAAARHALQLLTGLVRSVATVTPRDGQWQRTWRALRPRAREALGRPLPPSAGPTRC